MQTSWPEETGLLGMQASHGQALADVSLEDLAKVLAQIA
jgi:hypothetical protein